jgi:hypothetical protein
MSINYLYINHNTEKKIEDYTQKYGISKSGSIKYILNVFLYNMGGNHD